MPSDLTVSAQRPRLSLTDYTVAGATDPTAQKFKAYVDKGVAGHPDYGYGAADAVVEYARTLNVKYIKDAIKIVDEYVAQGEADIAAGRAPDIAGDDYLEAGPLMEELALAYDWGLWSNQQSGTTQLSEAQRTRWKRFGDQLIANLWSPEDARWGSAPQGPFAWDGWSINNPGNNYNYSFMEATTYWAVATCNAQWMEFLQTFKFPLVSNYVETLPGGGSREGTGYGAAHTRFFRYARMWREATGEELDAVTQFARQTIDYWIQATVPTLDIYAPFGDLSRESFPALYDYHENLVREASMAVPSTPEAGRAMWWIAHNSVPDTMANSFNLRGALLRPTGTPTAPTALTYPATGVGQLFARSGWGPDATWMAVIAGPNDESHAHEDQGAFDLYDGTWLAVGSNIWSHSGLQGNTAYRDKLGTAAHNIVRFDKGADVVEQRPDTVSSMASSGSGGSLQVHADLTPAYRGTGGSVTGWTRDLSFSDGHLGVEDRCGVGPGVTPVWQLHVPTMPTQSVPGELFAGGLRLRFSSSYTTKLVDMTTVDDDFNSGWRIELRNPSGCTFSVALDATSQRAPTGSCMTSPTTSAPCKASTLDTTFTKKPAKKGHRTRVKFGFAATDAAVTFECSLDGKSFKRCSTPFKVRVRSGKHVLKVRAVATDGTRDQTPAVYKFRVLR